MLWPHSRAMNVPVTRKGPKGTSLFKPFFFVKISPTPIIAPIKKAKNKATKIFGQPRNKPIKKANLMSPMPIHLPRETKTIARKKPAAKTAENIEYRI